MILENKLNNSEINFSDINKIRKIFINAVKFFFNEKLFFKKTSIIYETIGKFKISK